jgi:hypothetical protein
MGDVHADEAELALAQEAVSRWDQLPFTLGEGPRPYVLLNTTRQAGFHTGAAKIAMHDGRITRAAGVEVPDAVLRALSPRYQGADDPLKALAAETGRPEGRVLQITDARRGYAEFPTIRGTRTFPAWVLEIEDALGAAVVLDPDLEQCLLPGLPDLPDVCIVRTADVGVIDGPAESASPTGFKLAARLEPDGRTLTVQFLGSPAIYTDYPSAHAVEGRNAVAVVPIGVELAQRKPRRPRRVQLRHLPWHKRPGRAIRWFFTTWVLLRRPISVRLAYAEMREVTAVLTEPLGDRVVVHSRSGRPLVSPVISQ